MLREPCDDALGTENGLAGAGFYKLFRKGTYRRNIGSPTEYLMYIGVGTLVVVLLIVLIIYFMRRA